MKSKNKSGVIFWNFAITNVTHVVGGLVQAKPLTLTVGGTVSYASLAD